MKQIRKNVFETNSSSTHSVALNSFRRVPNTMEISEYDAAYDGKNVLYVNLEEFCSDATYTSQLSKLAYTFMQLASLNELYYEVKDGDEEALKIFYDTEDFKDFENEICAHIRDSGQKCDLVRLSPDTYGFIDHDSRFYSKDDARWYLGDDSIKTFVDLIFSEDSEIYFHFDG